MARDTKSNRFEQAGKALVGSTQKKEAKNIEPKVDTCTKTLKKKDKVITAKVYPETWQAFTDINKAQGMTNNSVINMLISEYVRSKKDEILG